MLSNRRRFLQGAAATAGLWSHAASAKVAPVTLKDRNYEPLKLPRPISLAALTVLDVSPANQVLCAAKAGYSHVGIRLVPATPTETQYDMIGDTPMIREVEANLKATGVKVLDIEILRIKPDTMDGILYQARNFRLSPGTGAADLVQLLKHLPNLPISIEACNANLALTMSPLDRARMYLEDMVAVLNAAGEH